MSGSRKAVTADQPAVVLNRYDLMMAAHRAVTDWIETAHPGLPTLFWTVEGVLPLALTGLASDANHDTPEAAAGRWAAELALDRAPARAGTVRWTGEVAAADGSTIVVKVWAIVDREAWEEVAGR